jgi:hypothetical protein
MSLITIQKLHFNKKAKIFLGSNSLWFRAEGSIKTNRRNVIGGFPSLGGRDKGESAAQNFVDIMVKIHNRIQNIKSPNSNRRPYRRVLGKLQTEGLLFVVGVSGVLKIICLSKI